MEFKPVCPLQKLRSFHARIKINKMRWLGIKPTTCCIGEKIWRKAKEKYNDVVGDRSHTLLVSNEKG